ncbi:type 1 fimbrial protein [Pseudomonas sp. MPFS]|uniref:fimbrial protein n=1 Tax=Pseudomonas sp. MPFS TaxID=2795724 RepID=UPI001F146702|nr:fimbrial protein [Pseudomonas sp. MPFS]UMZ14256.1 type 1 fimbrial protein [Pseudomonas sp. MPFS]
MPILIERHSREHQGILASEEALAKHGYPRRRAMPWLIILATLWLGLGTRLAFANSCTGVAQTIVASMPTSVTVPRDAAVGTVLTPWVSTAATNNYFRCEVGGAGASGAAFRPLSLTKTALTVMGPRGGPYRVWNTNLPGVGIAIGIRVYINGCGWDSWSNLGGGGTFSPPWVGNACNGWGSVINGGQAEMALVKTGPITPGTVAGGAMFEASAAVSDGGDYTMPTNGRKTFSLTSTIIKVAACTTPDVTVSMGSHKQSVFKGVGTTTPSVAFNLGVNACPAGLNAIQYQFIPINAVLDAANGVLALSGDSTATGIGLQLKDGNGNALKYRTQYVLTNYNRATGGSYTIPLRAAYYQTGQRVTPGSANTVLTFTMNYQ